MSIRTAVKETLTLLLKGRDGGQMPTYHPWYGRQAVAEILRDISTGTIRGTMAHRNLGWAQCAMCAHDGATVEELADINVEHIQEE